MKIRLYPAKYQQDTQDYKCTICGWQGYPEVGEDGWCAESEIMCPVCGPDALIEEEVSQHSKPDLRKYFI